MAFVWTRDLSVGVPVIDTQHQELILRVNILVTAVENGRGNLQLRETMRYLESYVIMHFGMEERLMQQHQYPGYVLHQGEHDAFIENYTKLRDDYERIGPTSSLAETVETVVVEWLRNHVTGTDRNLAGFIRQRELKIEC